MNLMIIVWIYMINNLQIVQCYITDDDDSAYEKKDIKFKNSTNLIEYTLIGLDNITNACYVTTENTQIREKLAELIEDGKNLIKYKIVFSNENKNPLMENVDFLHNGDVWHRTVDNHGLSLLNLPFNYEILSFYMLSFGKETIHLHLHQEPENCMHNLSESDKIKVILRLLINDLDSSSASLGGTEPYVCYERIKIIDKNGFFKYHCCQLDENKNIECSDIKRNNWIKSIFYLIIVCKLLLVFFGPVIILGFFYRESIRKVDYSVILKKPLLVSLFLKRIQVPEQPVSAEALELRQFRKLRRKVKQLETDEMIPIQFNKLQVAVDHRHLISENSVPIGVLNFFYEYILRCKIKNYNPFRTCCTESLLGSWSKFLWFGTAKSSESNLREDSYITWNNLITFIGGFLLILALPLPFYIRMAAFYRFENSYMTSRKEHSGRLNVELKAQHSLFFTYEPTEAIMIFIYIVYAVCFFLIGILKYWNPDEFHRVTFEPWQDLRHIKTFECLKMMLAHFILPFEKFGLAGFFIGPFYWLIALPICFIVSSIYCIPTLYLFCRILVKKRPRILKRLPYPDPKRKSKSYDPFLSEGVNSFESCFLLNNISPYRDNEISYERQKSRGEEKEGCCGGQNHFFCCTDDKFTCCGNEERVGCFCLIMARIKKNIKHLFFGVVCILLMLSCMVMFVEVAGYVIEIFIFTLMGAIANAGSAAKYVMLVFWIIVYCTTCFNNVYDKYMSLNSSIFSTLKTKMDEDIKNITILRQDRQDNTAFKYFTEEEIRADKVKELTLEYDSDYEGYDLEPIKSKALHSNEDNLEFVGDKLHWRVNNLVLFIDSKDVPRIPKDLFLEICEIEAPGCPGPVHLSLLDACKDFSYMLIFLVFVLIVVMSFGNQYDISSTNQMLLTLAGGFLPFVVRFALKPSKLDITLNNYSFEGKVKTAIRNFNQLWPVFDLSFHPLKTTDHFETSEKTVPDLVINVKDCEREDGTVTCLTNWPSLRSLFVSETEKQPVELMLDMIHGDVVMHKEVEEPSHG